jgi:virulence factor Mce-like protein
MRWRLELAVGVTVALVAVAGWQIFGGLLGNPGGPVWTAEFTNARGLLAGNDVRDGGAIVGRVSSITLSRQGTALVHFKLSDRRAVPWADAAALIEPEDLLGDNYMSLSPGNSRAPLRGPIPAGHTVNAPRLDEVLDSFQPDVRDGLQTLLVESGLALNQRGADIARATVGLRPALDAADSVLNELNTQNGSLANLVPVAQRAAAQLDSRRAEIPVALVGLSRTLGATARASGALGASVDGLPSTLARIAATSSQLQTTADAGAGLARRLQPELASLAGVARGLPALVDRVRSAAPALQTALSTATSTLVSAGPALSRLSSAFPVLRGQAPALSTLLGELDAAAPGIAEGFFVDFPDQADESGKQPFDPFADPRRAYWRGAAVFSCEAFGVPVAPGCLSMAIANLTRQSLPSGALTARPLRRTPRPARHPAPTQPTPSQTPSSPSSTSSTTSTTTAAPGIPPLPVPTTPIKPPPSVSQLLGFLLGK